MITEQEGSFKGTDRFIIKRLLGEGSFGKVYHVYDKKFQADVALKLLQKISPTALYFFKREFRSLIDISHPNLVKLYEMISIEDEWLFTMELIDGVDFFQYIFLDTKRTNSSYSYSKDITASIFDKSEARIVNCPLIKDTENKQKIESGSDKLKFCLNIEKLNSALKQLAYGLDALHSAGKLHRDIKPFNVLVTNEGRVVILDFSLVVEFNPQEFYKSLSNQVVGTICYMSPEQAHCEKVTSASDWYSVGVMLYEILTYGRLPFGENIIDILTQNKKIIPPSELVSDIPEYLNDLCLRLLSKNPEERPTGKEVIKILETYSKESKKVSELITYSNISSKIFVGREEHLKILENSFNSILNGKTVLMHVTGKSGMGKSVLIKYFLENIIKDEKGIVLSGHCYEKESVPYKAFDSLIDLLSRYLRNLNSDELDSIMPYDVSTLMRLFPVLERVKPNSKTQEKAIKITDPQELRRKAFSALRELLSRLANRKPLILSIDDFQWGDEDSVSLIIDLLRPPDPPIMMLILSYRSEEIGTNPVLNSILDYQENLKPSVEIVELNVGPLLEKEVEELVFNLIGNNNKEIKRLANKISYESKGNPFFVNELVRYIEKECTKAIDCDSKLKELTLDDVLAKRISILPPYAKKVLELVSVAGYPVSKVIAKNASGLSLEEFESAISILKNSYFITLSTEEKIIIYHDKIRENIINSITPELNKSYHYALAIALESSVCNDLEATGLHFLIAEDKPKAAYYILLAAKQASQSLAFDKAARLYKFAINFKTIGNFDMKSLYINLGNALSNAGRGIEAAQAYISAASDSKGFEQIDLKRMAAEQLLRSGKFDEGLNLLKDISNSVGIKFPKSKKHAILRILFNLILTKIKRIKFKLKEEKDINPLSILRTDIFWSATAGVGEIDRLLSTDFQTIHLNLALKAGEPYRLCRALALEAMYWSSVGRIFRKKVTKFIKLAEKLAKMTKHPHAIALISATYAVIAFLSGTWQEAAKKSQNAEIMYRENSTGTAWEILLMQLINMISLFYLGEIAHLTRMVPKVLKEVEDRNDIYEMTNFRIEFSHIILASDNPEKAQNALDEAIKTWPKRGADMQHFHFVIAQCHIYLYNGEAYKAWEYINDKFLSMDKIMLFLFQQLRIQIYELKARIALACAVISNDDYKLFIKSATKYVKKIKRENMSWSNPISFLLQSAIYNIKGDKKKALEHLSFAIQGFEAVQMKLYEASAKIRYGQLLGGEEGNRIVKEATLWMLNQKIKNPLRITDVFAPGFKI